MSLQAQEPQKKGAIDNAKVKQSTNPPAAPSAPTQPVVYAGIQQSNNPPATPPPTQPVVYAEVKKSTCSHFQVVSSLYAVFNVL